MKTNKILNEVITNLNNILSNADAEQTDKVRSIILEAYNAFQEDERDGVDYIFDINNASDVACCMRGGLTSMELTFILIGMTINNNSGYFFFGQNYDTPYILTLDNVNEIIVNQMESYLPYVMRYPHRKGYKEFYNLFVAPIWEN
jgi:hypothetical protein